MLTDSECKLFLNFDCLTSIRDDIKHIFVNKSKHINNGSITFHNIELASHDCTQTGQWVFEVMSQLNDSSVAVGAMQEGAGTLNRTVPLLCTVYSSRVRRTLVTEL